MNRAFSLDEALFEPIMSNAMIKRLGHFKNA